MLRNNPSELTRLNESSVALPTTERGSHSNRLYQRNRIYKKETDGNIEQNGVLNFGNGKGIEFFFYQTLYSLGYGPKIYLGIDSSGKVYILSKSIDNLMLAGNREFDNNSHTPISMEKQIELVEDIMTLDCIARGLCLSDITFNLGNIGFMLGDDGSFKSSAIIDFQTSPWRLSGNGILFEYNPCDMPQDVNTKAKSQYSVKSLVERVCPNIDTNDIKYFSDIALKRLFTPKEGKNICPFVEALNEAKLKTIKMYGKGSAEHHNVDLFIENLGKGSFMNAKTCLTFFKLFEKHKLIDSAKAVNPNIQSELQSVIENNDLQKMEECASPLLYLVSPTFSSNLSPFSIPSKSNKKKGDSLSVAEKSSSLGVRQSLGNKSKSVS